MHEYKDNLTYHTHPDWNAINSDKKHIVIVGGGIIGVCAAYFLTIHPDFNPDKYHITILESTKIAAAASGNAGGLLASWAFPKEISSLSFELHQALSDELNGDVEWGYRRITAISLEADLAKIKESVQEEPVHLTKLEYNLDFPAPKKKRVIPEAEQEPLLVDDFPLEATEMGHGTSIGLKKKPSRPPPPMELQWVKRQLISRWSNIGAPDTTAQCHPFKFCQKLLQKAMETGSVDLIRGKVVSLLKKEDDDTTIDAVTYNPVILDENTKKPILQSELVTLPADQIIVTLGPWTSDVLPKCPVTGLRIHSITVAPTHNPPVTPHALFTELKVGDNEFFSPEIYSRKDDVYVCGGGDTSEELPDSLKETRVSKEKCDELYRYVAKFSSNIEHGKVLREQACYLPLLNVPTGSGPIIGETNIKDLFIATGHSCWGINNAPITGLLLSEILLEGEAKSANITALDPKQYFDAGILTKSAEDDDGF